MCRGCGCSDSRDRGSAGPRAADATFDAFPGPGQVTYGQQIAYKATFKNTSGTTLTHVMFRQGYPVAGGVYATPVANTCPSTPTTISTATGPQWICDFGNQSTNAGPLALTVVWQVPTLASTDNCVNCLVSNGRWTIKEGTNDVSDPNDAFPPGGTTVPATLLASNAGGSELLKAGGYETAPASCADPTGSGNLRTNPVVSLTNPVSTTVCFPAFTIPSGNRVDLGYATTISETAGNARHSEVCIVDLGTNCGPSYVDANFAPLAVTHVFHVADGALPKGYKITTVSHNGGPATVQGACDPSGFCVVSITLENKTKIWTIVVTSPTNGYFDW